LNDVFAADCTRNHQSIVVQLKRPVENAEGLHGAALSLYGAMEPQLPAKSYFFYISLSDERHRFSTPF
jgi:hypothetical protein